MAFDHAIVLGGSISGLLSAAALAGEFDQVTIVDRDELLVDGPDAPMARRGVPQGEMTHHLLALGAARINELLPGLEGDLLAAGCEKYDNLADFAQWVGGAWRARVESDLQLVCFTRPVFEWVIRQRVLALPNVTALKGVASGLVASADGSRVVGARVKAAPEGQLLGDLVVDATGRGTKAPRWVEDLGYPRPEVAHVWVYMGYTCYRVRVPEGALPEGVVSVAGAPAPGGKIGVQLQPCGRGEHIVVAAGVARNYPPTDLEGILEVADGMSTPLVSEVIRASTPVSEPKSYQTASDQRHFWESLDRRPDGFVVLGDAVASYNPAYGQGMTMASVGAVTLRSVLRDADGEIDGLAEAFQKALSPHVDIAWNNAIAADSMYPGVELENVEAPERRSPEAAAALVALQAADPDVALAARRAMHWMDPSEIQNETIDRKIDAWIAEGRSVDPALTDPAAIPTVVSRAESMAS